MNLDDVDGYVEDLFSRGEAADKAGRGNYAGMKDAYEDASGKSAARAPLDPEYSLSLEIGAVAPGYYPDEQSDEQSAVEEWSTGESEPLGAWGVVKALLLLAAGILLIMGLSEVGVI